MVGGIDISPDGAAIGVSGPPRPTGLWTIPGLFAIPAPLGGPPQKIAEDIASFRWSPDGKRIAGVRANPLTGDAIVVANADGTDMRVLVPMRGGVHRHHVAWSHDGHYIYYAHAIEAGNALGEIHRVALTGGAPEVVVRTPGVAMHPAPTPDGTAVIYAGDRSGEGLNIWRHPLDGSADVRLTTGAGEYTEPSVSRDGTSLVCLARRRTGEVMKIVLDAPSSQPAVTTVGAPGSSDGEPSTSPGSDRIFVTSTRNGRQRIWSLDSTGLQAQPITSGDALDWRPSLSPDGTRLAFLSNRAGTRGLWIVAAEGGTPRQVVTGEVLDLASWSPDGRRLVYALAGDTGSTIWTVDAAGGNPQQVPGITGRVPAWSPTGDAIAVVTATDGRPDVQFVTAGGTTVRPPLSIEPVSLPTAMSWSPDGTRIALVNLPGRAAAEVWLLTIAEGTLRKVHEFAAPAELDGVTWTADAKAVLVGRRDFENEVLVMRGLTHSPR
jgi:Tol biopolymer transport system component